MLSNHPVQPLVALLFGQLVQVVLPRNTHQHQVLLHTLLCGRFHLRFIRFFTLEDILNEHFFGHTGKIVAVILQKGLFSKRHILFKRLWFILPYDRLLKCYLTGEFRQHACPDIFPQLRIIFIAERSFAVDFLKFLFQQRKLGRIRQIPPECMGSRKNRHFKFHRKSGKGRIVFVGIGKFQGQDLLGPLLYGHSDHGVFKAINEGTGADFQTEALPLSLFLCLFRRRIGIVCSSPEHIFHAQVPRELFAFFRLAVLALHAENQSDALAGKLLRQIFRYTGKNFGKCKFFGQSHLQNRLSVQEFRVFKGLVQPGKITLSHCEGIVSIVRNERAGIVNIHRIAGLHGTLGFLSDLREVVQQLGIVLLYLFGHFASLDRQPGNIRQHQVFLYVEIKELFFFPNGAFSGAGGCIRGGCFPAGGKPPRQQNQRQKSRNYRFFHSKVFFHCFFPFQEQK